jgi:peptide chain release factor 1
VDERAIERLEATSRRFDEIDAELAAGGAFDQEKHTALLRERSRLQETVETYREYRATRDALADAVALLEDPEMRELAEEERRRLEEQRDSLEARLAELLIPKDPDDDKGVFVEIRAGAGGDEAAIFAGDLARMYMRFAEAQHMKTAVVSESESEAGGFKEIVFKVEGKQPYRWFKHESGVHRVQRVPETEASGRIHTSTATVAVLPEADEDTEIEIKPADLQVDTFKASGAGGQYVNKTESAIRITHLPTGIVVASQQERSQQQNRERAMQMLRAILHERKKREQEEALGTLRRSQVGTGDRSEKIRTYNVPQDRVTDHRTGQSYGNIRGILDGDLGGIVEDLLRDERAKLLAGSAA